MKRNNLFYLFLIVSFLTVNNISAQSFWKKLGKSIEKVGKEVDKAIQTDATETTTAETVSEVTDGANTTSLFSKTTISTPHQNMVMKLHNITLADKNLVLELTVTNKGDDMTSYYFYGSSNYSYSSKIFDNLGNECKMAMSFGNNKNSWGGGIGNALLSNVPVKYTLTVTGFDTSATSLSQIRITGEYDGPGSAPYPCDGTYILKNIPIVRQNVADAATE